MRPERLRARSLRPCGKRASGSDRSSPHHGQHIDRVVTITPMALSVHPSSQGEGKARVMRMRIIATLVLLLMCVLAVWSSSHSDLSPSSDSGAFVSVGTSNDYTQPTPSDPAPDSLTSLTRALPIAAVALCLAGICAGAVLLERRQRLQRPPLTLVRDRLRVQVRLLPTARAHPVTRSLTELSLSRT